MAEAAGASAGDLDPVPATPHGGHEQQAEQRPARTPKTKAFWLVLVSILSIAFLAGLDLSAVSTALPTIAADLDMQTGFAWIGSAYAITSTASMPLFASLAMLFGRRDVLLGAIICFAAGSAIAGAAQNGPMLIAARTLQGIGDGGIQTIVDMVFTDIVAQNERGLYLGLLAGTWSVAVVCGPTLGGAISSANWRWLFWLNLPFCVVSFVLCRINLNLRVPQRSLREKVRSIDWANLLFVSAVVLVLLSLNQGGVEWSWKSWRTIFTIVFGATLLPAWVYLERKYVALPTLPWQFVTNRTTLAVQVSAFLHGMVIIIFVYLLPVWPQATKGSTPLISGLLIGPLSLMVAFVAVSGGNVIQITQRYRLLFYAGWIATLLGAGLFTLISSTMPIGQWIGFQILLATGIGFLYVTISFAMMAPLDPEQHALGIILVNFQRMFGLAVGVTVGGAILNSGLRSNLPQAFLAMLPGTGAEAAYAAIPLVKDLPEPLRSHVRAAYGESLSLVFKISTAFAGAGLLSALFVKELPLHVVKDERYALVDSAGDKPTAKANPDGIEMAPQRDV